MNDKKKMLVLGALVVVIFGVGAFQFTRSSSTPPPAAETKKEDSAEDAKKPDSSEPALEANAFTGSTLPQRDPFKAAVVPVAYSTPPVSPILKPSGQTSKPPMTGGGESLPPYPVLQGGLPIAGSGSGPGQVEGGGVAPEKPAFQYQLAGVITGVKSAAVFIDGSGNQRLVPLGGSLDGDTRVVSISRGRVTVRHGDETLTLTLGGNPSAK